MTKVGMALAWLDSAYQVQEPVAQAKVVQATWQDRLPAVLSLGHWMLSFPYIATWKRV